MYIPADVYGVTGRLTPLKTRLRMNAYCASRYGRSIDTELDPVNEDSVRIRLDASLGAVSTIRVAEVACDRSAWNFAKTVVA